MPRPMSSAFPDVIGSYMAIMLKVVDLPAPLGPRRPKTSPLRAPKVFLQTAILFAFGYVLQISIALIW